MINFKNKHNDKNNSSIDIKELRVSQNLECMSYIYKTIVNDEHTLQQLEELGYETKHPICYRDICKFIEKVYGIYPKFEWIDNTVHTKVQSSSIKDDIKDYNIYYNLINFRADTYKEVYRYTMITILDYLYKNHLNKREFSKIKQTF